MTTKLVNHDQVTAGLRMVAQTLNPFVQTHMTRTYGEVWLPGFVQRHPRNGATREHLGDLGFLIWVLTKDERAFGPKVLSGRARGLAHRVREARNLSSHDQLNDLDPDTARAALESMAEFLGLIGDPGRGDELRRLTGRLRPIGQQTPHAVRPERPSSTTRRPATPPGPKTGPGRRQNQQNQQSPQAQRRNGRQPGKKSKRRKQPQGQNAQRRHQPAPSGRPVIRIKIGCGAVVALVLVASAVAWVFFGQRAADPYAGKYENEPVGARLNAGRIEVPESYHLRFLDEPIAPLQGGYGGDLGFGAGRVSATDGRIVVLTRGERLGYATCRDTTRYTAATSVTKSLRICVTTDTGVVAGVAVKGVRRQGLNSYVKLDIVVWKGRKPKG
ncbi:Swt1 family HEPN domain-containing protein [Thermomonospora umbrina]|uniref:Swt1-like HEPN domain-containing protein n=1 Tax=Thermomonospora umbrina TaxID=111806 RepID=A0A3D9SV67_9ACTN|nr:Swt1 family HEPN domain-containing protein [Thermomonospora umbrina]REE99859.1 hypothetical protein DFJ69_5376 [Thermomonospora umbrina]